MKMMFKKAQHELWFIIFQMVLISMIFVVLMSYVNNLSKSTFYEKDFLSKDLALVTDTLFLVPGNIEYRYALDWVTPNFEYRIHNSRVVVVEEIDDKITTTSFSYGEDQFFKILSSDLKVDSQGPLYISFENSNYQFWIGKEKTDMKRIKYPFVKTKAELSSKKIHFASGIVNDPRTGKLFIEGGSFSDEIILSLGMSSTKSVIQVSAAKKVFDRVARQDADLIVIFNSNKEDPKSLRIYIPTNPDSIKQSRKLASLLMNSFLSNEKFTDLVIIPVESEIKKPAIYLLIGEEILKESTVDIHSVIAEGIREYYLR